MKKTSKSRKIKKKLSIKTKSWNQHICILKRQILNQRDIQKPKIVAYRAVHA